MIRTDEEKALGRAAERAMGETKDALEVLAYMLLREFEYEQGDLTRALDARLRRLVSETQAKVAASNEAVKEHLQAMRALPLG